MSKKKGMFLLLFLLFFCCILAVVYFNYMNKPAPAPAVVETPVVETPAVVEEQVYVVKEEPKVEEPKKQEPVEPEPRTKIIEKKFFSGNKGYIVRDKVYVYFGTYTVVREEVSL